MKTPAKIFDVFSPGPDSDAYQEVIDHVVELCGDKDDPRGVLVMGLEKDRNDFLVACKGSMLLDETAFVNFHSEEFRSQIVKDAAPVERPASLASIVVANQIADLYYKGRRGDDGKWTTRPKAIAVLVSLYQNPENRERNLSAVAKLPIEIFFVDADYERPGRDELIQRGGSSVALFDSWEEFEATEGIEPVIEKIANVGEIIATGGLAKDGKTWLMLSAVKALLTGEPFLGHFNVVRPAENVVYFAVETSRGLIKHRLKILGIYDFIREGRLLVRTLSAGSVPDLTDPVVLEAVKGADVFLDTAIRFSEGDENSAGDAKILSAKVQGLIAAGARVVWIAHHAPKSFRDATVMTLENMLRGSGDFAASISSAIGLRQLDEKTNTIFVQGVASRDMEPVEPFVICGRPHLNETGNFLMVKKPGEAGSLSDHVNKKNGRPESREKEEKRQLALELKDQNVSLRDIAEKVGVSKSTVANWLGDAERDNGRPEY